MRLMSSQHVIALQRMDARGSVLARLPIVFALTSERIRPQSSAFSTRGAGFLMLRLLTHRRHASLKHHASRIAILITSSAPQRGLIKNEETAYAIAQVSIK
jgi:hypothetical protein